MAEAVWKPVFPTSISSMNMVGSSPSITPVPWDLTPLVSTSGTQVVHRQNTCTYRLNKFFFLRQEGKSILGVEIKAKRIIRVSDR